MKLDYAERCVLKMEYLLKETIEDIESGHIYKPIAAMWEIVELSLRAIIYRMTKNTFEKPKKLIHELKKLMKKEQKDVSESRLIFQYEQRKRAVHRPIILTREVLVESKDNFCVIMRQLIPILKQNRLDTQRIEILVDALCELKIDK